LAQQAVGILVAATFPPAMRMRKLGNSDVLYRTATLVAAVQNQLDGAVEVGGHRPSRRVDKASSPADSVRTKAAGSEAECNTRPASWVARLDGFSFSLIGF